MNREMLRSAWLPHLTIWAGYFILLVWFYNGMRTFEPPVLKSLFIVLLQAGIFYLNFYYLLPRFFENGNYLLYSSFIFVILFIALLLFYFFDRMSLHYEIQRAIESGDFTRLPRGFRHKIPPVGRPPMHETFRLQLIWRQLVFNGFFVVMVLFISTIYRNIMLSRQTEKDALLLKTRVAEAESNMLKSQINPHFLFNTLNNIYSMAQLQSEKTPDAIHRLSEMLRYVIYDCNEKFVPLEKEIQYLRSYIELQLLRDEKMNKVRYSFKSIDPGALIAPMLLIPFIENSFKHWKIDDPEDSYIDIDVQTSKSQLHFRIENTKPGWNTKLSPGSGIGLENVRKRLNLIYPGKHKLVIQDSTRIYKVELNIDLHENQMPHR
ncbi:MAG: sensor histidine kinase [Bacteroidales bacterium]